VQRSLRVALLATVVEFGGIERVLLTLLQHMPADIELCPLLFTRKQAKPNHFLDGLEALKVPYDTIAIDTSRYKYFNPLKNIGEAITRFRSARYDLIHSHGYRANLIGFALSRYFGVPIVSTCHGYISTDWHLSLYNRLDVYLLRYFNHVIAVSERLKTDLVQKGVDERKIRVVTNALQDACGSDRATLRAQTRRRIGIEEGEFVFGFVGRLSEEKGIAHLLEALKQWTSGASRWRLVLVGDGPDRAQLERTARAFDLGERVIFAGFQTDTAQWYSAMDAFVLPSLTEGTPMVLLEAMASGLPLIATAVGGVPAMIRNGENGLLVPPANPMRLLEAMQATAANRELRERLSVGAAGSVRRDHSVAAWIEQVADVYTATHHLAQRRTH
jgi:glycosyltransferase involved in cell wall biosynthesis